MARPRDPKIDRKIAEAAAKILLRDGYAALTLTAVAEAAGVGKPALYRRYPSKAELVFAATVESSLKPGIPNTGSFAKDVRRSVAELVRTLKLAPRDILGEQIGRAMADPAFGAKMRARHIDPSLERMMRVWDRAVARGEVDPTVDGPRALRDLSSAVIMQVMLFRDQDEKHFQRELIARFLRSVAPR
jgi:AcrR family transcriptional regulator